MTIRDLARCASSIAASATLLAGCGFAGNATPATPLGQAKVHASTGATYQVLYNFGASATDGANPEGSLVYLHGVLYGTTMSGGSGCYSSGGCGTVFSLTTSGSESVLHSFSGGTDGALPRAGLTKLGGLLYGTTAGDANTDGTVFSIAPSGNEKVLHNFTGTPDGRAPVANLMTMRDTLYGTTQQGGSKGLGTIFAISPSGTESVLHSFVGGTDGVFPESSLAHFQGKLYGTTYLGGSHQRGVVFSATPSGGTRVLHNFYVTLDGAYPVAGLVLTNGLFYGTTAAGGKGGCTGCGFHEHYGTVFTISKSGTATVLHRFRGYPTDAAVPYAPLVELNGVFYGTTESGGANCAVTHGCGAIFSITPSGKEQLVYSFEPKYGAHPAAGLIAVNGVLYGTTSDGGTYDEGTVFSLTP